TFDPPQIYQYNAHKKIFVAGHYVLAASNEFEFEVGSYNHHLPLVIDPILAYSTYLAGSNSDNATSIAVDSTGNAYITGFTYSSDFPTHNPEQVNCSNACGGADVFVTKLNPAGSALIYSTFVGGSNYDQAAAVAVDASGGVYVSGYTESINFPVTNQIGPPPGYFSSDIFLTKLGRYGRVLFSTIIGGTSAGSSGTFGYTPPSPISVAVDSQGEALL